MDQREIEFSFSARYFMDEGITPDTRQIWFVLHGYGQLAKYFLKKFNILRSKGICVVAPEGLSRFYLENFEPGSGRSNDRVGATWMTKENRAMDIGNYMRYLDKVYHDVTGDHSIPATILGFSQGSATASRWALSKNITFKRLILWAGVFPADMDLVAGKETLKDKDVVLVYGSKDPFLTDPGFGEMKALTSRAGITTTEIVFDGGHEIDEQTLLRFV